MPEILATSSPYFTRSNAAYNRLLGDYVRYHAVLAIVGGLMTIVLLFIGFWAWRHFRAAAANGRRWTSEGKTYFFLATVGILAGLVLAVIVAARTRSMGASRGNALRPSSAAFSLCCS